MAAQMGSRTIRSKVGEPVEINLRGAGATGHLWRLEADASEVDLVDRSVVAETMSFGGQGTETFIVRPRKPGHTRVKFVLQRPWEKQPVEIEEIELEVE